MILVLILITILLVGLIYQVADDQRLGRKALDFQTNRHMEAYNRILEKLDEIERHLDAMPKMRQPGEP